MQYHSEIAELKQRIVAEYELAKNGLTGLASGTAQHQFITQKVENMQRYHERLIALVGQQEAGKIIAEAGL